MTTTGSLSVFDLASGDLRWRRVEPGFGEVAAGEDVVVTHSWQGGLVALDSTSGAAVWEHLPPEPATEPGTTRPHFGRLVAVTGGLVVAQDIPVGDFGAGIAALDARTGALAWRRDARHDLAASIWDIPGVTPEVVLLDAQRPYGLVEGPPGAVQRVLIALDLATGQTRWEADLPAPEDGVRRAVAFADDLVSVPWEDRVDVLDPSSGAVVEQRAPHELPGHDPNGWQPGADIGLPDLVAVDPSGRIGVATDGSVVALDGGSERWRAPLVHVPAATLVAGDGRVVVAERTSVAVYGAEGQRHWMHRAGLDDARGRGPWFSPPVASITGDLVVVVRPGRFADRTHGIAALALELATGLLRWQTALTAWDAGEPVADDGLVYLGQDDRLIGLTRDGGVEAMTVTTGGTPGAPAASGSLLYVAVNRLGLPGFVFSQAPSRLLAVDPVQHAVRWELELAACTDPVVAGGLVLVGTPRGLQAIDAATGETRWRAELTEPGCWSPAVRDGTVVVAGATTTVHGLDLATGAHRWSTDVDAPISSLPSVAGDAAYVGTTSGELVAVSAQTGAILWRFDVGSPVDTPPVLLDGHLAVLTRDGRLLLLE